MKIVLTFLVDDLTKLLELSNKLWK